MRIEGNTLVFKSSVEYFAVERDGLKPNTVRLIPPGEWEQLEDWLGMPDRPVFVRIESTLGGGSITREITYYSDLGEILGSHLVIFCWRHPSD